MSFVQKLNKITIKALIINKNSFVMSKSRVQVPLPA